ncbi:MAG: hypothetical protein IPM66_03050 [Acidobacteriota bacterium]|nr:MAG: hypothetical protein IPM66_03050 [Acidobacteriota bacterium]
MNPYTILLIFGMVILMALLIRLILPEVIYIIRAAVTRIRYAKYFLDLRSGRPSNTEKFVNLFVANRRTEASLIAMGHSLERINEIRELVFVYSNAKNHQYIARKWKPQHCIVEAANLLSNLASRIEPIGQSKEQIVDAESILAFIYKQQHPEYGNVDGPSAGEIERWLQEHPISIEQLSEIVFSAIFGIAYRYRKQRDEERGRAPEGAPRVTPGGQGSLGDYENDADQQALT